MRSVHVQHRLTRILCLRSWSPFKISPTWKNPQFGNTCLRKLPNGPTLVGVFIPSNGTLRPLTQAYPGLSTDSQTGQICKEMDNQSQWQSISVFSYRTCHKQVSRYYSKMYMYVAIKRLQRSQDSTQQRRQHSYYNIVLDWAVHGWLWQTFPTIFYCHRSATGLLLLNQTRHSFLSTSRLLRMSHFPW